MASYTVATSGGDFTTLEAAIEDAGTIDGDDFTITGTWSSAEDTLIAVADAVSVTATGSSRHIGRPHSGSETTWRHRNSSAGHSFTVTDTGTLTFDGLDIQNTSTGTSDECFRNNVANTITFTDCLLGFASRNTEQDILYTETTPTVTFENCHFYNAYRAVVDSQNSGNGIVVNFNCCTGYDIGFNDFPSSNRSGYFGKNGANTATLNIFNCLFHVNAGTVLLGSADYTANVHTCISNATIAGGSVTLDTDTNNVTSATITDSTASAAYIVNDVTTSPFDLRLTDHANNTAQDNHANGSGAGLTAPSTDIVGTSRPQNTNYDIGAFEILASGAYTLAMGSGSFTLSSTTAALVASRSLAAASGSFSLSGTAVALNHGYYLATDSGSYSLSGTAVALLASRTITANSGSFALSGTAVGLNHGFYLATDSGSYSLSGTNASLTAARNIQADSGSYALTGTAAGLVAGRTIAADSGSYALTGTDVTLTYTPVGNYTLTADSGSFTLTGTSISLLAGRALTADSGSYSLTGTSANLSRGFYLSIDSGSFTLTGATAGLIKDNVISSESGSYLLTGTEVSLTYSSSQLVPFFTLYSNQTKTDVFSNAAPIDMVSNAKPIRVH